MNIKIVGSDCSNGIKLRKMVMKAAENYEGPITIELFDDKKTINNCRIKNIPGLFINDALISEGKVLSDREIYKILKTAQI